MFLVPLILVVGTLFLSGFAQAPEVQVKVTDRYSGQQLAGAEIVTKDNTFVTGQDGAVALRLPSAEVAVTIASPGYEAVTTTLERGGPAEWRVALRPNVLHGRVTDADSKLGIPNADVAILRQDAVELQAATDGEGRYSLDGVPDGAVVRVESVDYGEFSEVIGQRSEIDFAIRSSIITGHVADATGAPLANARVAAENGSATTLAGPDGTFRLTGGSDVTTRRRIGARFLGSSAPCRRRAAGRRGART